jgi:lysophospholipase L1-like esterase
MHIKRTYILLFAVLLTIDLAAQEGARMVTGQSGLPYFSPRGTLDLIGNDIDIKVLKRDRLDRTWVLWEAGPPEQRDVFLGRIQDRKITHKRKVSRGFPGMNHSPEMDFCPANQPWVTWVNIHQGQHRLYAADLYAGSLWDLSPGNTQPLFTPKLLFDGEGRVWVFWVGPETGCDEIHYRTYHPDHWSRPTSLTRTPSAPQFHPSVALSDMGYPAVAWSSFDGTDYEICYTAWTGAHWRERENISRNHNASDGQPSLVFLNDHQPAVAWTRADAHGTDVYLSLREQQGWLPAANVSRDTPRSHSPSLVSQHGQLALSWKQRDRIFLKRLELPLPLMPPETAPPVHAASLTGHLDEEKFIGFGDSITFGSMNGPGMGVGYVPRLQTLLVDNFSDPLVVNRGIPGEPTWEGVSRINSVIAMELGLYLLLMEGTNDITEFDYSSETTAFNLEQMILACRSFGVMPLISSIIPRAQDRWVEPYIQRTLNLNINIQELAQELSVTRVDSYGAFAAYPPGLGGHEALISGDNLHPNDTGYQLMAETWESGILSVPFPPVDILAVKRDRNRTVTLTWGNNPKILDPSNLQFFRIYRQVRDITDLHPIAVVPASLFSYVDTNVQVGTNYRYALTAINKQGVESQESPPVDTVRGEPFPPVNVSTETVVNSSFLYREYINIVGWEENPGNDGQFVVTRYKIYRKLASESDVFFRIVGEVPAGQSGHEYWDRGLQSLEEASQYAYGVSALDSDGNESLISTDMGPGETGSSTDTRVRSQNRRSSSRNGKRSLR